MKINLFPVGSKKFERLVVKKTLDTDEWDLIPCYRVFLRPLTVVQFTHGSPRLFGVEG